MAPPLKHILAVWFFVFLAYALTLGGHLFSPDDEVLYRTAESLATSGTLAVAPIVDDFATSQGIDHKFYAQYGIGQPILAIPFCWAGRVVEKFYHGIGLKPPHHIIEMQFHDRSDAAYTRRFVASWFNIFVGASFAAALFMFAFMLSGQTKASLLTALLYALGTMAWPQSRTFFSEPLAALCAMGGFAFLYASFKTGRIRLAALAGACCGYAMLTRLDSLLAFPGIAVFLALANACEGAQENASRAQKIRHLVAAQFKSRALLRWLAWGLPICAAFAIYALLNLKHFGTLRPAYSNQPEGINFGTPLLIGLHGFLCSIGRGLFFFSPPLALFFWSIRRFVRRDPALGWGLIVSISCFLGAQSLWINWAGGWCWGPRHIFMIHWMLALPILALLMAPRSMGARMAYCTLMILGIAAQIYGSSVNFNDYYKKSFRELGQSMQAMALYSPEQEEGYLRIFYEIKARSSLNEPYREPPLYSRVLVAPINDSVYIFQNSQWPGNLRCIERGLHDNFWLHFFGACKREKALYPIKNPQS
ncbi:MAG: hypothetical protein NTX50_22440 [Candidatus Sumerlaeota bacterium]|nr:hypothetical protein [Candidatus Sumerlaeota bacterium]